MNEMAWPPASPHAALLSSPSGRRKFQEQRNQRSVMLNNPPDDEDDEETLRLQLAAIEAKLKLKRLQQSKAKSKAAGFASRENSPFIEQAPTINSPAITGRTNRLARQCDDSRGQALRNNSIDIPLSPTRRPIQPAGQSSPSRVLLGIDKGRTGAEVSLRRALTVNGSPLKMRNKDTAQERTSSRISAYRLDRTAGVALGATRGIAKSFSERMAEARETDKIRESKREIIDQSRTHGFQINQAELESYRLAADEASSHRTTLSPSKSRGLQTQFSREEVILSGQRSSNPGLLRKSRTMPNLRGSVRDSDGEKDQVPKGDPTLYEPFSEQHLTSRILPHTFLKRTIPEETFTTFTVPDLLQVVTSPAYELPDSVADFVVFGIIASKSSPMNRKATPGESQAKGSNDWEQQWEDGSQNQKRFMMFTLTDLKWSIDVFLFSTAVPRYHRMSPGTVVAILNPSIMPPKRGKEDTGAFSLTLNSDDDKILEIGTSRDLGFCKSLKKDGKECGSWVNASKTEICEWHLGSQVSKTQAGRMGVNTGTNGFHGHKSNGHFISRNRFNSHTNGVTHTDRDFAPRQRRGGGLLPRIEGQRRDVHTGNHYFIAPSNTTDSSRDTLAGHSSGRSTASMLDDDPFLAEGDFERDKATRLRKRLATEEKERAIARKLVSGHGRGAGAEYLRHRAGLIRSPASSQKGDESAKRSRLKPALAPTTMNILGAAKRAAESVRLSPAKKTRFLTDKGVKEAGRESLGPSMKPARRSRDGNNDNNDGDDDDDDDLDIV